MIIASVTYSFFSFLFYTVLLTGVRRLWNSLFGFRGSGCVPLWGEVYCILGSKVLEGGKMQRCFESVQHLYSLGNLE